MNAPGSAWAASSAISVMRRRFWRTTRQHLLGVLAPLRDRLTRLDRIGHQPCNVGTGALNSSRMWPSGCCSSQAGNASIPSAPASTSTGARPAPSSVDKPEATSIFQTGPLSWPGGTTTPSFCGNSTRGIPHRQWYGLPASGELRVIGSRIEVSIIFKVSYFRSTLPPNAVLQAPGSGEGRFFPCGGRLGGRRWEMLFPSRYRPWIPAFQKALATSFHSPFRPSAGLPGAALPCFRAA